jgi:hypothetical protein
MVADFDSPSYFVAIAAVELGFFKREGIAVELERTYGAHNAANRLRDGTLHFFGGPAYSAATAFPAWKGAKLLCALSQYSYWFLAIRADLDAKRGDHPPHRAQPSAARWCSAAHAAGLALCQRCSTAPFARPTVCSRIDPRGLAVPILPGPWHPSAVPLLRDVL